VRDREDESTPSIHAAQAARALAAIQPSTTPPTIAPIGDRAAAIAAIEHALRTRARRRWQRRWVLPSVAVAAAAAAAGLVLVIGSHRAGPSRAGSGPVVSRPSGDDLLGPGAELQGPGSFEIAPGTRLRLDDRAGARVLEAGASHRFRLRAGAMHAEVAKLTSGQRFVVETPDAEVEVKGTRFDVTIGPRAAPCAPATQTTVTVEEGIVAVRFAGHEVRLGPGQSWPDCRPAAVGTALAASSPARGLVQRAAARGTAIRAAVGTEGRPRAGARPASGAEGPAPSGASTLAEQNDLMAAALSARQRGNVAEALRWLDRLLDRFPAGQLAGSARAERRRLVDGGPPARAPEPR